MVFDPFHAQDTDEHESYAQKHDNVRDQDVEDGHEDLVSHVSTAHIALDVVPSITTRSFHRVLEGDSLPESQILDDIFAIAVKVVSRDLTGLDLVQVQSLCVKPLLKGVLSELILVMAVSNHHGVTISLGKVLSQCDTSVLQAINNDTSDEQANCEDEHCTDLSQTLSSWLLIEVRVGYVRRLICVFEI